MPSTFRQIFGFLSNLIGRARLLSRERRVVRLVKKVRGSPEYARIRQALNGTQAVTFLVAGIQIQVEPGLPPQISGMTNFPIGFCLGPGAATSETELTKTLLHEVYRLNFGAQAGGGDAYVDGELARTEADQAFDFADRAFDVYFTK